ncbi:antibiotic biosynthesis monooxygenase family protein [Billgrantia desiderata]|uniref:Antibiotic biosynthesis monooxygenase n=1 Tax=Billgrantia desiderata TaxID=52021 RepID=A0AAW4YWK6_9GAMM|nr:antibiotic biosynthesis monooxygenase [Halomonas desiderata]MCE8009952.1 antibiotic biosynthesis monooxygenase [Halomonas desiderata]MCE8028850.1 antibiotic biosynthesis monooxygenase [Halomonas desiderata]MCE8042204.1 antibiotic biosynthesis monooxygenase [Halomonas desiderata]MCE8046651.1 antibiotic biosynthesis monooxygenase [Halomonas desiderata]MCE8053259.1 antibiotic biosynthesis monooxygenase [Halomonas desiderata]
MSSLPANTPSPPYYAVIFTSIRTEGDNGYGMMAERMVELAAQQPGFLGIESARDELGVTVSYWQDLESIQRWKQQVEHREAQRLGRSEWYAAYKVRIARVEREYSFGDS